MNFRQVRKKIKTISNVKQITKAMQMVSSVKMKKAQEAALESKVYREILDMVMNRVISKTAQSSLPIKLSQESGAVSAGQPGDLIIFITSNKGLCGCFNLNLFKMTIGQVNFDKDHFISVGKKGAEFLLKMRSTIIADFSHQEPFVDNVSAIFATAYEKFVKGEYKKVFVIYNQFISTLKHQPFKKLLLPLDIADIEKKASEEDKKVDVESQYLIEPSPEEVFESLLVDFLQDKIRSAIQDSEAGEQSARMIAMKNATDSAGDLIYNLTLLRNKLRQTSITNELLEITTAKESTETGN